MQYILCRILFTDVYSQAIDSDAGVNAEVSYYLIGRIQMTLTEGLENLRRPPFLVERETGEVQLNFDPQQGMKGYFDFMVSVYLHISILTRRRKRPQSVA